jgi:hypothetical protein
VLILGAKHSAGKPKRTALSYNTAMFQFSFSLKRLFLSVTLFAGGIGILTFLSRYFVSALATRLLWTLAVSLIVSGFFTLLKRHLFVAASGAIAILLSIPTFAIANSFGRLVILLASVSTAMAIYVWLLPAAPALSEEIDRPTQASNYGDDFAHR